MNREQVFALIRDHLAAELEVDPGIISESTRFKEDVIGRTRTALLEAGALRSNRTEDGEEAASEPTATVSGG